MGMGTEDKLALLVMEMVKYATRHSFQGESKDADLVGFCELNKQYSQLERRLHPHSYNPPPTDKWDMARNKIVTYITSKFNNMPPNPEVLAKALLLVAEPYLMQFHEKIQLRKAL